MQLSEKIRTARQALGLSQDALAAILGKTQGAVSQWEQGLKKPEFDAILPLANALNVTLDWLLGSDDSPVGDVSTSLVRKTGMQVITLLSTSISDDKLTAAQLHLVAALITEFSAFSPAPAPRESP